MSDDMQQKIFTRNLNRYVSESGKTQKEIAQAIKVSPQTFNTWTKGIALPRMAKIQALADYFHILKSDLIDDKPPNQDYVVTRFDLELLSAFHRADASIQTAVCKLIDIDFDENGTDKTYEL